MTMGHFTCPVFAHVCRSCPSPSPAPSHLAIPPFLGPRRVYCAVDRVLSLGFRVYDHGPNLIVDYQGHYDLNHTEVLQYVPTPATAMVNADDSFQARPQGTEEFVRSVTAGAM